MKITNYEQIDSLGLDALREIGSIGLGNAATALASLLSRKDTDDTAGCIDTGLQ